MRIDKTYILRKFGEAMFYQTQISLIFVILFLEIGQCFRSAQTKSVDCRWATDDDGRHTEFHNYR